MDNLQIGIGSRVLGPRHACTRLVVTRLACALKAVTLGCLACTTLVGCAPKVVDTVPLRAETPKTLVMSAGRAGFDRNDGRLGTQREALSRSLELSNTATFDRQRIVNGRPYTDFDTITRSRESFSR